MDEGCSGVVEDLLGVDGDEGRALKEEVACFFFADIVFVRVCFVVKETARFELGVVGGAVEVDGDGVVGGVDERDEREEEVGDGEDGGHEGRIEFGEIVIETE